MHITVYKHKHIDPHKKRKVLSTCVRNHFYICTWPLEHRTKEHLQVSEVPCTIDPPRCPSHLCMAPSPEVGHSNMFEERATSTVLISTLANPCAKFWRASFPPNKQYGHFKSMQRLCTIVAALTEALNQAIASLLTHL